MSDTQEFTSERVEQLQHRVAAFVAYATERFTDEHSGTNAADVLRAIYHSGRYVQLSDFNTFLYTYTFAELYELFEKDLLVGEAMPRIFR